jgi:hypothetical protein
MTGTLSQDAVKRIVETAAALGDAGDLDGAWAAMAELRDRQPREPYVARALVALVDCRAVSLERSLDVLRSVFLAHGDDDAMLGGLGSALEAAHDLRFLNDAPPSDDVFRGVAERLRSRVPLVRGSAGEVPMLVGLSTAGRLLGRAWDSDAESAYRRLLELRPTRWQDHYNFGLFLKIRGRFAEGLAANRRAAELGGNDESVRWNLGICATGARDGATALGVWKELGQKIEMGRFGLPEGGYAAVKVRLAQHPLAEREAGQSDPGLEETIWIERLSPCHGVVRSALFQDLGIDYGDVVLFDGAPVTHHKYGEQQVPVFPQLVTLERPGYRTFPFVGTQPSEGALAALSESLPGDAVLYSHSEQFVVLCAHCWGNEQIDHGAHRQERHHVVRGKVCLPPDVAPAALRDALDAALASADGVRVFAPDLSRIIGDDARADVEARRAQMIGEV